mgnify:CR=1 FL=1
MLFRHRDRPPFWRRLLGWLWPRSGFKRAMLYIWHRVARLPGTAHSIAAGFASGAAVSFTPFLGLRFLMGFVVAWLTRGNLVASAIGTAIGNPWTFPIIFALTGKVGAFLLGERVVRQVPVWDWEHLSHAPFDYIVSFLPVVFPLLVGGIPAAIVVWLLIYFSFKKLIVGYRKKRADKLEARKAEEDFKRRREAIKNGQE